MRLPRVLGITAFVAALGAIGGALGGFVVALTLLAGGFFTGGASLGARLASDFMAVSLVAGAVGAGFGVVLGPLYAWTLLRRAPLWRAVGETALAAAVGAGLGIMVPVIAFAPFAAALLFSAAAALRLRRAVRPQKQIPERT